MHRQSTFILRNWVGKPMTWPQHDIDMPEHSHNPPCLTNAFHNDKPQIPELCRQIHPTRKSHSSPTLKKNIKERPAWSGVVNCISTYFLQPRIRDIARLFCNDLAQMMRKLVNTSCWKCERRTAVNPTSFYTLVRLALTCACFGIWDLHCPHEFVDISWQVMGQYHSQNQHTLEILCISTISWWYRYTLVSSEDLRAQACSSVSASGPAVNIFVLESKWISNNTSFTTNSWTSRVIDESSTQFHLCNPLHISTSSCGYASWCASEALQT